METWLILYHNTHSLNAAFWNPSEGVSFVQQDLPFIEILSFRFPNKKAKQSNAMHPSVL